MPLNQEEEAKFAALRKSCKELGVPSPPEIHIGLEVVDKNGVLVFEDKQRGHSWTRNFWNFMFSCCADIPGNTSVTSGEMSAGQMRNRNLTGLSQHQTTWQQRGNSSQHGGFHSASGWGGLMVGSGDAVFDVNSFNLSATIGNGTGGGQLTHGPGEIPSYSYDSIDKKWTSQTWRVFNNNSDSEITLRESGLFWAGRCHGSSSTSTFLFERSVLNPVVPVPVGAQLTVTYEITMDFSAID